MSKINIPFDNSTYSIDESSLSSATSALQSHFSTVMNGYGAVITLGGTSYNVDSTKLQNATNNFIAHLGTISGSGKKVVVGGVEYNVDSAKMSDAIAELHAVLGGLHSGGGDGTGEAILLENGYMFVHSDGDIYITRPDIDSNLNTFNLTVGETYRVTWNDSEYTCVAGEMQGIPYIGNLSIYGMGDNTEEPFLVGINSGTPMIITNELGFNTDELGDATFHTVGIYKATSDLIHNEIHEGAYYGNLITGVFYDEMPATVSDGDAYLYGNYMYRYYSDSDRNGWGVQLATEEFGITTIIPDYPITDRLQTSYDEILGIINGVPVIYLGQTFINCTNLLAAPALPSTITNIGDSAFAGCNAMTQMDMPDDVTSIGEYAFLGCSSLTELSIPNGVTSIGNYAFKSCTGLTELIIPSTVTSIGSNAFYDCSSLISVDIPDGVSSIQTSTFQGCSELTEIVIPSSMNSIGANAFDGCSKLTNIIFEGTIGQWCNVYIGINWRNGVPATFVQCSDGQTSLG